MNAKMGLERFKYERNHNKIMGLGLIGCHVLVTYTTPWWSKSHVTTYDRATRWWFLYHIVATAKNHQTSK